MGSRRGWFGSSTLPFLQWLSERLQFGEDAVIAENTLQFDLASLQEMVASHFTVDVLRVSPSLVGEPVERQRLYIIFLKRGKRQWSRRLVSECEKENKSLQEYFESIFARRVSMLPDEKFRAPAEAVRSAIKKMEESQRLPPTTSSGKPWSCFQACTAAVRAKIVAHTQALKDKIGPEAMQDPEVLRNWTCNLAQHPEYMGPTSGTIPAMLQKTELWLFAKKRLALPKEHLEVQGFNLWGQGPYVSHMRGALDKLKDARLKSLAGNAMHVHVLATVVGFVLACTEPEPALLKSN